MTHACGHDAHTAILLGTAQALASVPELPVGVRLIFQAAEELMPGGAIDAIAAGALTGVSRIFALHCDPRLAVGRVAITAGPITSAADSIEITLHSPGGHTSRPHLTADLVYGLGTLITGLPGVLSRRIDPRTSTVDGVGSGQRRCRRQRDPADRAPWRAPSAPPAVRPGWTWKPLSTKRFRVSSGRWASSTRCSYRRGVPPVVNEEVSTRIYSHAIEAVGPGVLADTRQSGGGEDFSWYLEEVPGAMAGWVCGAAVDPNSICTSPHSTSTSVRSAVGRAGDGQSRRAVARRSDLALLLRESSLNAQGRRVLRPGPMLRAGRVRRSWTYSPGAPAISAASAITPR